MKKNLNDPQAAERRRKAFEGTATFGLLLLAVGLVAPFTNLQNGAMMSVFKWIFGAGAVIYTVARIAGGSDPDASLRMRRLHRMEIWAGIAFCVATFFWFYNTARMPGLTLGMMRDTVVFTLAGAVIQIVAAWMMTSQRRKETEMKSGQNDKKK